MLQAQPPGQTPRLKIEQPALLFMDAGHMPHLIRWRRIWLQDHKKDAAYLQMPQPFSQELRILRNYLRLSLDSYNRIISFLEGQARVFKLK